MEILKREMSSLLDEEIAPFRRTANEILANPVMVHERDDITRQRLLFATIVREHYDTLFTGDEKAERWEELRHLMIKHGAHTLVDKDWKYVTGCYWQNIRKECIRRMGRQKAGTVKAPRPAQVELDHAVSDIMERRGQQLGGGAEQNAVENGSKRGWNEEEDECGRGAVPRRERSSSLASPCEDPLLSAKSECLAAGQDETAGPNQSALAQLIRNATPAPGLDNQQGSSAGSASASVDGTPRQLPPMLVPDESAHSAHLGRMVQKLHSLLLSGGYGEMAADFEQQLRQMVTSYKAWMFDQLFQDDLDGNEVGQPPNMKRAKYSRERE